MKKSKYVLFEVYPDFVGADLKEVYIMDKEIDNEELHEDYGKSFYQLAIEYIDSYYYDDVEDFEKEIDYVIKLISEEEFEELVEDYGDSIVNNW